MSVSLSGDDDRAVDDQPAWRLAPERDRIAAFFREGTDRHRVSVDRDDEEVKSSGPRLCERLGIAALSRLGAAKLSASAGDHIMNAVVHRVLKIVFVAAEHRAHTYGIEQR